MFAKFCKYCAALPHIHKAIKEDLEFHKELSHVYHRQFKQAMKNHLWNANKGNRIVGSIGKWFLVKQPQQNKEVKNSEKYDLLSLRYPRFRIESLKILPQDDTSICRLHTIPASYFVLQR